MFMVSMSRTAVAHEGASGAVEKPRDQTFGDFFQSHQARLFKALWLITRNRHEAEEIAQEAFLRVWEKWPRVESMDDPVAYLYRTAMNVFRNRARRAALALRRVTGFARSDDELAAVEARDEAVRALAHATPGQRAALVLTELLGLSSEEAATALGVKSSTVRVQVARGRDAIRAAMDHVER